MVIKMKNKFIFIMILSLFMGMFGAYAAKEDYIEVVFPGLAGVQNQQDAIFTVKFDLNKTSKCDVVYSPDKETEYKESYSIRGGVLITKNISISHLKKQVYHDFTVTVYVDGVQKYQITDTVTIIEVYKPQPLDKFSTVGIHATLGAATYHQEYYYKQLGLENMAGVKKIRPGSAALWFRDEVDKKGNYNFRYMDAICHDKIREYGMECMLMHGVVMNSLYTDKKSPNLVPKTKEEIDGFNNYLIAAAKHFPEVTSLEVWNEPDISFWKSDDEYAIEYTALAKAAAVAAKEAGIEKSIIGGVVSGCTPVADRHLKYMFEQGMGKYVDGFSFHPYIWQGNADVDGGYEKMLDLYDTKQDISGDWQEKYISEIGWPALKDSAITEEKQGEYMLKAYILADYRGYEGTYYYNFFDVGTDEYSSEHVFGLVKANRAGKPKQGYAILANATKQLNSARYIGKTEIGENITAHIYLRDGKPMMAAWCQTDTETADLKGNDLEIADYFGNPVETDGSITFVKQPYFITGIGSEWVDNAVKSEIKRRYAEIKEQFGEKTDISEILKLGNEIAAQKGFSKASIYDYMRRNYKIGEDYIANYSEGGDLTEEELGLLLFDIYEAGNKLALLSGYLGNEMSVDSGNEWKATEKKIESAKNGEKMCSLAITEKIARFANKYADRAAEIKKLDINKNNKALIYSDSAVAGYLYNWAQRLAEKETPDESYGVLSYTYPTKLEVYQDATEKVRFEVDNKLGRSIDGKIRITDENGNTVGEETAVSLAARSYTGIDLSVPISADMEEGTHLYHILLSENGELLEDKWLAVEIKAVAELELMPAEAVFDELNNVSVKVINKSGANVKETLEISGPENWKLGYDSVDVELEAGETKIVSVPIVEKHSVAFNEYNFECRLKSADGKTVTELKRPLDFPFVMYTGKEMSTETFNGDISAWTNAYPLHAGIPAGGLSAQDWQNANIAMRTFMKWDNDYMYILADVYDNKYYQGNHGGGMWQGDSIQLGFGNADNKEYIEYTFAQTTVGAESYSYSAPPGEKAGERPSEWVKVVYDDEQNILRYLVKLPKSALGNVSWKKDSVFKTNVAANDADILSRDKFIQITKGLADTKSPEKYYDYTLIGEEKPKTDGVSADFKLNLNNTFD